MKGTGMKTIGTVAILCGALGFVGFFLGWFSPNIYLNVNPEVTSKVETFTHDTIESAQDETNKAFESLKHKAK